MPINKWQMGFNSAFKGLNLNFHDRVLKNTQLTNFKKIPPVEDEFFYVDRRKNGQKRRT
jgi:hypothetical protein